MDVQRFKVSGEDWLRGKEVVCGEIIEASLVCLLWDYYYQVSRIFGSCLSRVIECEIFRYNDQYIYFNTNVTSRRYYFFKRKNLSSNEYLRIRNTQDYQNHNRNQQNKCALILEISVAQASPLFTLEREGTKRGR